MSSLISALVVRSVKADPAFGSDMDTATTILPLQTSGMTFSLSSSEAKCSIAFTGPTQLSNMGNATAEETFANSSITNKASRLDSPKPPYLSETLIPKNPISEYFFNHSLDKGSPVSSMDRATSTISF